MADKIGFLCSECSCYTVWHFRHKSWCPLHKSGYHSELMGKPQCIPDMVLCPFSNASGCRKLKYSRVMDISTQALSNFLIMEFSLMNEKPHIFKHMGHFYIFLDTTIKLSTPDTCEMMFTMKMCLQWLRAKVPRRTKNLSHPPFLQNQKIKN